MVVKKSFFLAGVGVGTLVVLGIYFLVPFLQRTSVFEKLESGGQVIRAVENIQNTEVKPAEPIEDPDIHMLFVGDIMLDRYVRQKIDSDGLDVMLEGVKDTLLDESLDLNIGNLEGTVSNENPRKLQANNTMFRFRPDDVKLLLDYGFDIVSQANNHSRDFGRESNAQKEDAHAFIDAGADLIIGAHPHVVQPFEVYNGKLIVYSLGNFMFDQVAKNTTDGLMMKVSLEDMKLRFDLLPVNIEKSVLTLMDEEEKMKLFERLAKDSEVSDDVRMQIENGFLIISL